MITLSDFKKFTFNLKKQDHLLLQLPSAIVPNEFNYLLNPLHKDISKVKILNKQAFDFDERLV